MALGDHPKILATTSFAAVAVSFGWLLHDMLNSIPDPPFAPKPEEHVYTPPEPGTMHVEVPLPNPIVVALPLNPPVQVQLYLAATAEGPPEVLAALEPRVKAEAPRIEAELLLIAQTEIEKNHDPAYLHKALPAPMRAVINKILGTPEMPEPATEVLIVSLTVQGG